MWNWIKPQCTPWTRRVRALFLCGTFALVSSGGDLSSTAASTAPVLPGASPPANRRASDSSAPTTPNGLVVAGAASNHVALTWSPSVDDGGAAGYRLMANGAIPGNTTSASFSVTGLLPATRYEFALQAFDAAGNYSTPVSAVSSTKAATAGRFVTARPTTYASIVPTLQPGDTLVLEPGNYLDDSMPGLQLRDLNGTAKAPITIMGDPTKPRPVLMGRGDVNTVRFANSSYILLKHLEIDSLNLGGDGVRADGVAHHITLEDLVIKRVGPDQSTVGISTNGGTTWNWVIRRCVIDGAGTGLYLGNSLGGQPFIGGVIENNLVINTLGYNLQIKHQFASLYPSLPGMPVGPSVTVIRNNVFSKSAKGARGTSARPNLLVGSFPLSGPGSSDRYEIYGNFFYGNPTEGLFQGEGNIAFHHNLLVNPWGIGLTVQVHKGEVRDIQIYANTILATGSGIRVSGGAAGYTQRVVGNAVFAGAPIRAGDQASNVTGDYASAVNYLVNPMGAPGALDLYPKAGMLQGASIDRRPYTSFIDFDRDFNGQPQSDAFRGAYGGSGKNPGWLPRLEIKP